MENKIEVGEYVRTKYGCIVQVVNINDFREPSMKYGVEASYLNDIAFIGDEVITKHSKNIIDLIEVRDIIQIKRGLYDDYNFIFICSDEDIITAREIIENYAINILTHEQYEQNCYRLEE